GPSWFARWRTGTRACWGRGRSRHTLHVTRNNGTRITLVAALVAALVGADGRLSGAQRETGAPAATAADLVLLPTNHPRLLADLSQAGPAPLAQDTRAARTAAAADLLQAVKLEVDLNFAKALPLLSQPSLQQGPLADYAAYYRALAELRLGRTADARATFHD